MIHWSHDNKVRMKNIAKFCRGKVLDIGCKNGELGSYLTECEYFPIDAIKKKIPNFKQVNIEKDKLPYPSNSFDTIVIGEVLEHLENYFFVLRETHRVLKPDGNLVITIPNIKNIMFLNYVKFIKNSWDFNPKLRKFDIHFHIFSEEELINLLTFLNFKVIHVDRIANDFLWIKLPESSIFKLFARNVICVGKKSLKPGRV